MTGGIWEGEGGKAGLSPLAARVRAEDPDRWLTLLFAQQEEAPDLLALYAFNLELAEVAESVREPLLGEMRLQWWSDALEAAAAGQPFKHPVVESLASPLQAGRLPLSSLQALVESRRRDLDGAAPECLEALLAYAEATAGALNALVAGLAQLPADQQEAAQRIGTAWGLVGLLRAVPYHVAQGRVFLPKDLLARAGLSPQSLPARGGDADLAAVAEPIAAEATRCLAAARTVVPRLPRQGRSAFLLAALTDLYLGRLRRAGWNLFAAELARRPPLRSWRLLRRALLRRT